MNRLVAMRVLLTGCVLLALIPMQGYGVEQLDQMLVVALGIYALARGLNAVISVAQGTELSVEPMGVGVTLAPGQILDPLNDLIEQFSVVLLVASASLGVQKILLGIGDLPLLRVLLVLLTLAALLASWWRRDKTVAAQGLVKIVLVLTLLRLAVPALGLVSNQVQLWLAAERAQAVQLLQQAHEEVGALNAQVPEQPPSWLDNFRQRFDISSRLDEIERRAEAAVEATVYLLAEFILINVLLPLLFLYVLGRAIGGILSLPSRR